MSLKLISGYHMAAVSLPYWPHCPLTPLIDDSLIGVNYADLTSGEHLPATRALAQIVITNLTTQSLSLLFVIVIDKYKFLNITKGRFRT